VGGQSNSIAVIQDNYGDLVANNSQGIVQSNLKQTQPKSEQKFRSQTHETNINRNHTRLTPTTNPGTQETTVNSTAREQSVGLKQKAVR